MFDGRGLIAAWLIIAAQLEVHGMGLPARISGTAETFIILLDANRCDWLEGGNQQSPRRGPRLPAIAASTRRPGAQRAPHQHDLADVVTVVCDHLPKNREHRGGVRFLLRMHYGHFAI